MDHLDRLQAVIDRGQRAQELLQSDVFNIALGELARTLEAEIVSSLPHETKKRESAYYQHKGLQEIAATLHMMVQLGADAIEELNAATQQKDNETE